MRFSQDTGNVARVASAPSVVSSAKRTVFVSFPIPAVFTACYKQNNCYPKAVTITMFLEIFYFHFLSWQYILWLLLLFFNNNKSQS